MLWFGSSDFSRVSLFPLSPLWVAWYFVELFSDVLVVLLGCLFHVCGTALVGSMGLSC